MQLLAAFLLGSLFGIGLILAGMANPAKVQGFLDLAGVWDPSLMLVMAGAISVALPGFLRGKSQRTSWLGAPMQLPARGSIDARLIVGSLAFGIGWGLAGFCPGPALVSLGSGELKAMAFVAAMLIGMVIHWRVTKISSAKSID